MTATLRSFTLTSTGARPLTVNAVAKIGRFRWAKSTAITRGEWAWLALEAKAPKLQRAAVTVTPLHANNRSPQDVSACSPASKAAIDGLCDAGVLPGDGPAHLVAVTFLPPVIAGVDGMTLTIEEVA